MPGGEKQREETYARACHTPQDPFYQALFFSSAFLTCELCAKEVWETCGGVLASTLTSVVPSFFRPILLAAARERSMIRPLACGPRSSILTCTAWPVSRFVTFAAVPNGSVGWAAVSCCW